MDISVAMEIRRPLKRNLPRLGPPDIYPQDPKQKEDELTSLNVKQGYTCAPLVSGPNTLDEFGTAKNANIDAFGVYFSALLSEKHRINTIKDTQKKKQLVNTKEIWYVHAKTKNAVDNWFRDLANGTKSLGQLGKRIPIFNSKEGMFSQLYESHVPHAKAVWFIKMSAVHTIALSESSSKSKKRQVPDQYQEVTAALTKYLKDILFKLFEYHQQAQQQHQIQQSQQQLQPDSQSAHLNQHTQGHNGSDASQSILTRINEPKPINKNFPSLLGTSKSQSLDCMRNQDSQKESSIPSLLNDQTNFTANLHTSVATLVTSHTASIAALTSPSAASFQTTHEDFLPTFTQWQYQTQLARYLFDEGLLDRYDFLCFLLELIEKKRSTNDLVVKLICPLVLEYVTEFSKSVVLSRRLAHVCAKKICQALHHNSPSANNAIYILSSILQVICIECPTAMVRHYIVESKFPPMYQGSPLDQLPCLPSDLPMLDSDLNNEIRRVVKEAEREILHRSAMADSRWSCTSSKKAENFKALLVCRLLSVLDTLDRHNFEKNDSSNSYDTLYSKIFPTSHCDLGSGATSNTNDQANHKSEHSSSDLEHEDKVVKLLCEWATTTQRTGEHRAIVVAKLLQRRQSDLQVYRGRQSKITPEHQSIYVKEKNLDDQKLNKQGSHTSNNDVNEKAATKQDQCKNEEFQEEVIEYVFQSLLIEFLDENAPIIEESHSNDLDVEKAFNNLVLLFGELIRCDVFSHYNYMCTLISRGMFNELVVSDKIQSSLNDSHIDDVDADLGKILQDIKEGQQDEAPPDFLLHDFLGGPRDDSSNKSNQMNKLSPFGLVDTNTTPNASHVMSSSNFPGNSVDSKNSIGISSMSNDDKPKNSNETRHMIFVKHFPIPDDENFVRDINQRNVLLHGFGKEREEARHTIKKLNKEIGKLVSRRASRDINDGGRVKKIATRDCFNPEATLAKFETLNYHDKHVITNSLSAALLEMFTGVSNGQTFALPTLESVSFIFDLFCMASNIGGLLELVVPILEELPDVEAQIKLKCPMLVNQYTHSIALCIVGILYRYHSCVLLFSKEELCSTFESLYKLVAHVQNPGLCLTSAERVILCYLHDLYSSQSGKLFSQYSWLVQKVKQQVICFPTTHTTVEPEWSPTFFANIVTQLQTSAQCFNSSTNPVLNAGAGVLPSNNFSPLGTNDLTASIRQQLYFQDSLVLRQLNETPAFRYRFVCDAIYSSTNSPTPDLVSDIAVLCADLTAKCSYLTNDWIQVLQALLCSGQRELNYRKVAEKINISDTNVINNLAIFTAVLVARRCIQLDDFIIKCAMGAILAPLSGSVDRTSAEAGFRLTCHLLLTLFRNRESPSNHSRGNQPPLYNSQSAFGPSFPSYGSNAVIFGAPMQQLNSLSSLGNDSESGRLKTPLCLKYLCDYHLLRSACCNIKTAYHITLLKAIRMLAMWATPSDDIESSQPGRVRLDSTFDDMSVDGLSQSRDGLDARNGSPLGLNESSYNTWNVNLQSASLHQFADAILKLLCSQRWLHDKCLSDSDVFSATDTDKNPLLDSKLDVKQSQRLLYMICYNKSPEMQADVGLDDQGSDQVASIVKMFENIDVWSMRLSLLRLQFMFAYCKSVSSSVLNDWLDNLAKAVVEFFQKASQDNDSLDKDEDEANSSVRRVSISRGTNSSSVSNINRVWLIKPLLNKLTKPPNAVHSKIIKASAALMESASVRANSLPSLNQTYLSTAAASTKFKERTLSQRGSASTNPSNLASTSLLGFQPFLSLLLSCLKNQDKERETLLTSLNSQLYQAIHEKVDDIAYKQSLQDGLELRLCLIGRMFDTIQRSPNLTSDWATLLLLLIMNTLVDPQLNYRSYVSVLDMLAMLIQTAYASDPIEQKEEVKKQYQNLMKKFRKELAALEEKGFIQMKLINPLMPLVRQMTEVITCEPMGSLVDTKGEKVENFYSIDKKKGLKVSELQEVSPWDLIEGHKNPAPLCWPWFGTIKLEYKPLKADENNRLMAWHTHMLRHDTSYYCQMPSGDDGPSSAKRSNVERKPSQSNPLLKSLIEASEDPRKDVAPKIQDDEVMIIDSISAEDALRKDDLLVDYCELPVDSLFDSTPIEAMIEDIKSAMQAEDAILTTRVKAQSQLSAQPSRPPSHSHHQQQVVHPPTPSLPQSQPQPPTPQPLQQPRTPIGPSTPLGAPTTPLSQPPLTPQPVIDTKSNLIGSGTQAASILAPVQTVAINSPRANTPQMPSMSALQNHLSVPPIVSSIQPEPKPKAPRKKRVTKKEAAAAAAAAALQQQLQTQQQHQHQMQHQHQHQQQPPQPQAPIQNQQQHLIQGPPHQSIRQTPPPVTFQSMAQHSAHQMPPHNQPNPVSVNMQQQSHPRLRQHTQQIHPQQQHQMQYQSPQQSIMQHQHTNVNHQPQHIQAQQIRLPDRHQPSMSFQSMHQHQVGPPGQSQMRMQPVQHQHMQQTPHQIPSQPRPVHQIQYQQQHQHQMANQHQPHMQPQQIRLASHQQQSSFQPIQPHQPQHQAPPQQQPQQIFAPQQAAGHSRPALTAMLHQKHAAASNMDNKMHQAQPRFSFG